MEPVPPLEPRRVPPIVKVPDVENGPPVSERPVVPPDPSTEVTVPPPPPTPAQLPFIVSKHPPRSLMPPEKVEVADPVLAKAFLERISPEDSIAPDVVVPVPTPNPPLKNTELVAVMLPKYGELEALNV